MKKSKTFKIFSLILVVLIAVICVAVADYFIPEKFITGSVDQIEKITITYHWAYKNIEGVKVLEERTEIEKFCDLINSTDNARNVRFPEHNEMQTSDPKFIIDVEYLDGNTEQVLGTEGLTSFYRYLTTKKEGNGYVRGTNKDLAEYIFGVEIDV